MDGKKVASKARASHPGKLLGKKSILLVDGEEENRDMLGFLLREEGHRVASCCRVAEAENLFEQEEFDFVITEHSARGVNGLYLLAKIKQSSDDVRVLVMSYHKEKRRQTMAIDLGAVDYIRKPVNYAQIQRLVGLS